MKKFTLSQDKNSLGDNSIENQSNQDQSYKNQRDDNSPPDLDEIINKLKKIFFGNKKNPSSSNDSQDSGPNNSPNISLSPKAIIVIIIIALGVWLATGFYIVNPAERGVILRLGKYVRTTLPGPNWHFPFPISKAYIVDVDQIRNVEIGYRTASRTTPAISSIPIESLMLTVDENIIDVRLAVQYRISNAEAYLFNVKSPDLTLTQSVESAIREIVGKNTLNFVLTSGRDQVATNTRILSQKIIDRYKTGVTITSINMQDVQPPEPVQAAFNDAVKAREDRQKLINKAEAYSNDIIPRANGLAARMIEEAKAYSSKVSAIANGESKRFISIYNAYKVSPKVTEKRLFIETMEQVLKNTPKIIIDSNNSQILNLIGTSNNPIQSLLSRKNTAQNNFATRQLNPNTNLQGSNSHSSTPSRLQRALQRITR